MLNNFCWLLIVAGNNVALIASAGHKRKIADADISHVDPFEYQKTFMIPTTDSEAESVFRSAAWADFDQTGVARLMPSLEHWQVRTENVPAWMFEGANIDYVIHPLAVTDEAKVFAIKRQHMHKRWAVKYQAFCSSYPSEIHPLLREAYFLELVNRLAPAGQIANEFLYISASVQADHFSKLKSPYRLCLSSTRGIDTAPAVRFMISERVGESLAQYSRSRAIKFDEAIRLTIQLVGLIERLHSLNIVHGDLHPGNIAFKAKSEELVLIDFERARIVNTQPEVPDPPVSITTTRYYIRCHGYTSPWESIGVVNRDTQDVTFKKSSFRDDMYRVLIVLAELMYGYDAVDLPYRLCKWSQSAHERRSSLNYKELVNWFDVERNVPATPRFPAKHYVLSLEKVLPPMFRRFYIPIRQMFAELLHHVRRLEVHEKPNYGSIRRTLESLLVPEFTN